MTYYQFIDNIKSIVNSFKGKYKQEVPAYSAVKVNGKKSYEYYQNEENILDALEVLVKITASAY